MKFIVPFIILVMLCGCTTLSRDQEQALSQTQADIVATAVVAKRTSGLPAQLADLINADLARINSALANAALPAPAFSAATLAADPVACHDEEVSASAAPPAKGGISWAWLGGAGLMALWVTGRLAPSIPGLGTAVGALANAAWGVLSHADQKAADAAATDAQQAAVLAKPVLASVTALAPPGSVTPAIAQALDTLAAATPAKGT